MTRGEFVDAKVYTFYNFPHILRLIAFFAVWTRTRKKYMHDWVIGYPPWESRFHFPSMDDGEVYKYDCYLGKNFDLRLKSCQEYPIWGSRVAGQVAMIFLKSEARLVENGVANKKKIVIECPL